VPPLCQRIARTESTSSATGRSGTKEANLRPWRYTLQRSRGNAAGLHVQVYRAGFGSSHAAKHDTQGDVSRCGVCIQRV
jgi:hypothetical protein